jgi:cytidylate kinase
MKCNAERLIEALITVEMMKLQQAKASNNSNYSQPYVITVSRDYGAMGKEVAQLLADTLEIRCCDREILQEVARRAHVDEKLVAALDEHVSYISGHWWQKLLLKDGPTYEQYYHHLVKTILSISRCGGVIVGRGGNFILGSEKAFRIRITGSDEKCAERIAQREQLSPEQSLQRVQQVNHERMQYIRMLYHADINDHASYDLVLNSDRYDRVTLVELILDAMEKAGYVLADDTRDSLKLFAKG